MSVFYGLVHVTDILFSDRNGEIFILHDTVGLRRFIEQHFVVFGAKFVEIIIFIGDQDRSFKLCPIKLMVIDREFNGNTGTKRIDDCPVAFHQFLLFLVAGNVVVNIRKPKGL